MPRGTENGHKPISFQFSRDFGHPKRESINPMMGGSQPCSTRAPNRTFISPRTVAGIVRRSARIGVRGKRAMLAIEAKGNLGKMDSGKEIKVKIPVGYHIKLHTLKVLRGQSISDTVEIALEKYFESHPWPEGIPVPVRTE